MVEHRRRNGNLLIPSPLFIPSCPIWVGCWAELQEDDSTGMDRCSQKGNVESGHLDTLL